MGLKEDIDLLDSKIARLKTDYEQYFMRLVKREPAKLREEVERLVLLYSNKSLTNTTLKFRYNTLVAKFSSYKQYWTRVLRAIDEGTFYPGAFPDGYACRAFFGPRPEEGDPGRRSAVRRRQGRSRRTRTGGSGTPTGNTLTPKSSATSLWEGLLTSLSLRA